MSGAQRWGWHCLTDAVAKEIVESAHLKPGDLVLDIGAGSGALTKHLALTGARVIAIELHPKRVAQLRRAFEDSPNVKVVRADAFDLWLPRRPFYVVANPPFACMTSLMSQLLASHSRLLSARIVLQRTSARRYANGVVKASRQAQFHLRIERLLPRSAFVPRPNTDAALLSIHRLSGVSRVRRW